MNIDVLESYDNPERVICQAARGDMYGGYIGDTKYAELMKPVDYEIEDAIRFEDGVDEDEDDPVYDAVHPEHWSYDRPSVVEAKTRSFIRKQASRGHWGIWENPQITIAIENMSVVTERQVTRHRHLSFDVQSMRYVDFEDAAVAKPKSLTDPEHQTRAEGMVWYDMDSDTPLDEQEPDVESMESAETIHEKAMENSKKAYQTMLDIGVPAEDARYALPLGTQINVTMSGNARTMMHVLNLRQRGNAQWEIRELSDLIVSELEDWIPHTTEWWEDNGPVQISP